jgi:hypothetical protein
MEGDRFFYLMVLVIALIGVGLFAIPVRAHGNSPPAGVEAQPRHDEATHMTKKVRDDA